MVSVSSGTLRLRFRKDLIQRLLDTFATAALIERFAPEAMTQAHDGNSHYVILSGFSATLEGRQGPRRPRSG
jgi:hypothetical protein